MRYISFAVTALVVTAAIPAPAAAQRSCAFTTAAAGTLSREDADAMARETIADTRRYDSDYDRCRELGRALMLVRSATTARLFFDASRAMEGDYELAELLVASAERGLLEERTQDAFFAAVRSIEDDFQRARVLGAALGVGARNTAIVKGILTAAAGIRDDYQLASVLVAVARATPFTGPLRELYGATARQLDNKWEYRRAMEALPSAADLGRARSSP